MKNKFLTVTFAILTMELFHQAHAATPIFLECSERGKGDFYAEVRLNQNQVATEIIIARYFERQGPINPKLSSVESVFQKSNPPRFVGYKAADFYFIIQNSSSGPYLILQNQVRQSVVPCKIQRNSAFPNLSEAGMGFNKILSMTQGSLVQCCYLNCQTGNSFCKQVPQGQCVHHTCH